MEIRLGGGLSGQVEGLANFSMDENSVRYTRVQQVLQALEIDHTDNSPGNRSS